MTRSEQELNDMGGPFGFGLSVEMPHRAVRPDDYPKKEDIGNGEWPPEPPYCTRCGKEMLTVGDLTQEGQPEWHAEEDLNPARPDPWERQSLGDWVE